MRGRSRGAFLPAVLGIGWALGVPPSIAQTMTEFPLRPSHVSKAEPLLERVYYRQNAYDERGFNRVIEQVSVPTLTLYPAAKPAHRNAAIVICPGGGYRYVVIDREGHMIARFLQQQGITSVVLKYRLPNPVEVGEWLPDPQLDALDAIRHVREHAAEWGIDARRVGVLGFSAGGHLAGSTAVFGRAADGSRPDFVGMLYPVVTLKPPYHHKGSRENLIGVSPPDDAVEKYSLEQRVTSAMPPFFLAHARDDSAVPVQNSEMLAAALQRAGVPVELRLFATGGHGFALGRDAESSRWKDAFLAWLDQLP